MATDLSVFNRDDVQTFVNLALRPPYSFPMLDFAYCVDNALPSLLPDRMIHIAEIIQQAFGVYIEPYRLIDKLSFRANLDSINSSSPSTKPITFTVTITSSPSQLLSKCTTSAKKNLLAQCSDQQPNILLSSINLYQEIDGYLN
ncbi:unnamed protein product [Rotaria sp. Silwood1]|nr:unnamed protein product [Rotaria sp. Silwood1]